MTDRPKLAVILEILSWIRLEFAPAPVVQRIEHGRPKSVMGVRFPPGAPLICQL